MTIPHFRIALAALISVAALTQNVQAESLKFDTTKAGTYKVDTLHTQVIFAVNHLGFTDYWGMFSGASGSLQLDPATLANSRLDIAIEVDTVTTTSGKLSERLKGEQWFDVAKFPRATFVSSKVVATGQDTAEITGDFTLHGISKPVVLHARLTGSGISSFIKIQAVGFEATGTFKRSDFGLNHYLPMVGDEVKLTIAGAFDQRE